MTVKSYKSAALSLCLITLAACNMTGMAPSSPPPAPVPGQPVMLPQSENVVISDRSSSSQRITSDGSLRTDKRSSSVSVDPTVLIGTILGASGVPAGTFATPSQIAGFWSVQQPDGMTCKMLLRDQQIATFYTLQQSGCTDSRMVKARSWTIAGGNLRITTSDGQAADLTVQAANRAEGSGFVMWR